MRRIPIDGDGVLVGEAFTLDDEAAHHVVNVLRCRPGERLELFDGAGNAWLGELRKTSPATVLIERTLERSGVESECEIILYQAMPKRDRFEWLLEKATELGVARIVPIETHRSVVRIPPDRVARKVNRWEKIVAGAARQSQRVVVPEIAEPQSMQQALQEADTSVQLFLHPDAGSRIRDIVEDASSVAIWVGPEGGFTEDEVALLSSAGTSVSVGPRILRSETAGVVSVALVQEHTGGLDG